MVTTSPLTTDAPQSQYAPGAVQRPFAPHCPRPPLSKNDYGLLDCLLKNNLNFDLLACQSARTIGEILDWAEQPAIKERIEHYQRLQLAHSNSKLIHSATNTRVNAMKHLESLVDQTYNPVEKRRIVQLALRYAMPLQPTSRAGRLLPAITATDLLSPLLLSEADDAALLATPAHRLLPEPPPTDQLPPAHPRTPATPTPEVTARSPQMTPASLLAAAGAAPASDQPLTGLHRTSPTVLPDERVSADPGLPPGKRMHAPPSPAPADQTRDLDSRPPGEPHARPPN
jgi:hypothetical protein